MSPTERPAGLGEKPLCILVVDDHEDAAESFRMMLTSLGHDVRAATNGPAAVELLDGWEPDVAILDLKMKPMGGPELAEKVLGCAKRRPLMIAVTGLGQPLDFVHSRAAGFDYHLLKPCDPAALAELIRKHADTLT